MPSFYCSSLARVPQMSVMAVVCYALRITPNGARSPLLWAFTRKFMPKKKVLETGLYPIEY